MDQEKPKRSSPSSSASKVDVFLSFTAEEDTGSGFTESLYEALTKQGVYAFGESEALPRGSPIAPKVLNAIREAQFAVIILSPKYANSASCLIELAQIVDSANRKSGQTILPIFYDVEPTEVRKQQTGNFGEALINHERAFPNNIGEVKKWRKALKEVANRSGWTGSDFTKRGESEVIKEIAEMISNKWSRRDFKDLIGMDARIEKVKSSVLNLGSEDVLKIGISGMAGIGKTTLARAVFDNIRSEFDSCCFLLNVRESINTNGIGSVKKDLCKALQLYFRENVGHDTMDEHLRKALRRKKVLIVLDDVDYLQDLGVPKLGPGSRVIITARDKQTLRALGVPKDKTYEAEKLTDKEAFQLLCRKAFEGKPTPDEYIEPSYNFVKYAGGHPLALRVLGSFLCGKKVEEWSAALATLGEAAEEQTSRLTEDLEEEVFKILKLSYGGLGKTEREMFLDIACFFRGENEDRVTKIFESCRFHPGIGIPVLIEKSFIKVEDNVLWMHDLLQKTGWQIVREQSREKPGKRSRLWLTENQHEHEQRGTWLDKDACDVVIENSGTDAVQGLYLSPLAKREIPLKADPFLTMHKLRLLKICNVDFLDAPFEYLSNNLRVLEWYGCPLQSLPSGHQPDQLVILRLPNSRIQTLWSESFYLDKLILMDLSYCSDLVKSPDLSTAPNLQELTFEGCENLSDVHPTVWGLQKLKVANFKDCTSVESLPNSISMHSLETLVLTRCSRLKEFPEIVGDMEKLSSLYLDGTGIKELSTTIQCLTGLLLLNLRNCKNLVDFPSVICSLTSLKTLLLSYCSRLDQLPEDIGSLENLEILDACGTAIRKVPSSIVLLKNLKTLCFYECRQASSGLQLPRSFCGLSKLESLYLGKCNLAEGEIPVDIGCVSSLQRLRIQENNFVSLPESISELSELKELRITRCSNLQSLPKKLPSSLLDIDASGCPLLAKDNREQLDMYVKNEGLSLTDHEGNSNDTFRTRYTLPISAEHTEQLLPDLIERYILIPIRFELRFNVSDIPHWCSHKKNGSVVAMQISDLEVKKCSGIALFVAFDILESENFEENWEMLMTACFFEDEQGFRMIHGISNLRKFRVSRHVVFCFVPIVFFNLHGMMSKGTQIRASVFTLRPDLEVKSCGLHPVFQHEVTKFARDLSEASASDLDLKFGRHCKELINIMMETEDLQLLLSKLYEGAYGREKDFGLFFPHKVIPFWFFHNYVANEALCVFPQGLYDDQKWIGLELSAVVSSGYDITVDFSLDVDLCCNELHDIGTISTSVNVNTCLGSDQLVVIHIPRMRFPKRWNQCDGINASFSISAPDRRILTCGSRLLYEHDVEDWIRVITVCASENQDVIDSLCKHIRQLLASYLPENSVEAVEAVEQNSVEGESRRNECSSSAQRENSNLILDRRRVFTSLLHNYKSYLLQKHGVIEAEKIILHSKSMKIQRDPNPVFSMHHLHVMVETVLYGSLSSEEWKRLLELLLKYIKTATLSIKGQVIAVLNPFSPSSVHNFCFPQKELPGWFIERSRIPRFVMKGLHNVFHNSSCKGLAICAAFQVHERPSTAALDNLDAGSCNVMWHLGSFPDGRRCLDPAPVFSIKKEKFKWLHLGGFIWLTYIPRSYLTEVQEVHNVEARIYTDPGLMLTNWGVRILFEWDVEEFNQAIVQCWTSFFDNMDSLRQFVESDVNELSSNRGNMGASDILMTQGYAKDFSRELLYNTIFPHRPQLMDWFIESSTDTFVEIRLPPSLSSNENWIGLALCAHFSDVENQTTTIDEMNDFLVCHLEAGGNSGLDLIHHYQPTNEEFKWFSSPTGFIWQSYIPRQQFQDHQLNDSYLLKASFMITSQSRDISAARCGLRLLYQHHEQEFKHLCTSMNLLLDEEIPERSERHDEALDRNKGKQISAMPAGHVKDFSRDIKYNASFPHSRRLMEWMGRHQSMHFSVEIQLPPPSSSDGNWLGLVLYASFKDSENRTTFRNKASPEETVDLVCQLETDNGCLESLHCYRPTPEEFKWLSPVGFIWLSYLPRQWFLDRPQLNMCGLLKASFASESRGLFAVVCGVRLLYQQDEQEFNHLCIKLSLQDIQLETPQKDFIPQWFLESGNR